MRVIRHPVVAIFWSLPFSLAVLAATPADTGAQLFLGQIRFGRGGPACAACHQAGGIHFPNGGNMGPDLTHVYSKMGIQGLQSALQTLYFPAMNPLFATRPLAPEEQQALLAFFANLDRQPPPADPTGLFAGIAGAGFVLLMALTWAAGRRRIVSVRRALLERAGATRR